MNPRIAVPAIAGWLFADLLLAFSIVVLGTQEAPPRPEPTPTPSLSPTPSPSSTRQALERKYTKVELTVNPRAARNGAPSAIRALRRAIARHPRLHGRKAGIVLTFGAQHDGGERFARAINKLLPKVDRKLFGEARTRDFQIVGGTGGAVILDIYLFYEK